MRDERTDGLLWDEEIPLQTYQGTAKRILIFFLLFYKRKVAT